jgi:hypothetical protein
MRIQKVANLNRTISIIGLFLIISLLSSCKYVSNEKDVRIVKYEILGTAHRVTITFVNASGETETFNHIEMPWERNIYPKKGYLYLSVQNERHHGSVTARIWVDGKITKESTSSGPFVTATVSDILE